MTAMEMHDSLPEATEMHDSDALSSQACTEATEMHVSDALFQVKPALKR